VFSFFKFGEADELAKDDAGYVIVHTDGACSNNGKTTAKVESPLLKANNCIQYCSEILGTFG
jgi:secreted PhoX family phosphatase